jgi:hypothetical protein
VLRTNDAPDERTQFIAKKTATKRMLLELELIYRMTQESRERVKKHPGYIPILAASSRIEPHDYRRPGQIEFVGFGPYDELEVREVPAEKTFGSLLKR